MDPRLFRASQLSGPAAALLRQGLQYLSDAPAVGPAKAEAPSTVPPPPDEEANFEEANDNDAFFDYEVSSFSEHLPGADSGLL